MTTTKKLAIAVALAIKITAIIWMIVCFQRLAYQRDTAIWKQEYTETRYKEMEEYYQDKLFYQHFQHLSELHAAKQTKNP